MKQMTFLFCGILFLLSSCAIHDGLTTNANNHTTEVVLSEKNFTVIESVQGEAEVQYILGIGGTKKKSLIAKARANMLEKANIEGSSKAVINETIEMQYSLFPFWGTHKVIVTAHVIEFID